MYLITANYLNRSHHANKNKFKGNDKGSKKKRERERVVIHKIIASTFSNFTKPKLI